MGAAAPSMELGFSVTSTRPSRVSRHPRHSGHLPPYRAHAARGGSAAVLRLADGFCDNSNRGVGGNGGGRGGGGGGGGEGSFGGSGAGGAGPAALLMLPAIPELKRDLVTPWNVLLLAACIALPWFGVIVFRRRVDEYVMVAMALGFVNPIPSAVFAILHVFCSWDPLRIVPRYVSLISSTLVMLLA